MKTLRRLFAAAFAAATLGTAVPLRAEGPPVPEGGAAAPTEPPSYVYTPVRDPFIPLVGPSDSWTPVVATTGEEGDFKPETLELSGILKTRTGRWAMLRSPGGGYLVKDGKIYDSKRKAVKGYVGIVKEKTIVVIGPNNKVTELVLTKSKEQKTP